MTAFLITLCVLSGALAVFYFYFAVLSLVILCRKQHFQNWQEGIYVTAFLLVGSATSAYLGKVLLLILL